MIKVRKRKPDPEVIASRAIDWDYFRAPHPEDVTPMPFQYAGAEYAIQRDHCLIGDPPGLGKSCQSLLVDNVIKPKRTLILCPASLRLNWQREVYMWSDREQLSTYPVLKSADGVSNKATHVILSYALLASRPIFDAIMDLNWDHVILDECQALKDPKGNTRTKGITGFMEHGDYIPGLINNTGRFSLLSGTPMPNQPVEAYNAIRLCDWDTIDEMSLEGFRNYYYAKGSGMVRGMVERTDKFGNAVMRSELHHSNDVRNQPRRMPELQERLRKHIMVRRSKKKVLPQLPPVRWHPFPLEMSAEIRKALKHPGFKEAEHLHDMDPEAFDGGIPIDGQISTARRELGEAKAPQVAKYIEELLEEGIAKIVVSAWHTDVLDYLRERLKKHGLVFMTGKTSSNKKQMAVDAFQGDDRISIILGQKTVLGLGWTLTESQDVVDAEPDWVPGVNDQLLDRINRIGQTGAYTIGHLAIAPGTLDERIINNAIKKSQVLHDALDKEH